MNSHELLSSTGGVQHYAPYISTCCQPISHIASALGLVALQLCHLYFVEVYWDIWFDNFLRSLLKSVGKNFVVSQCVLGSYIITP